jgi:hypothetical protein
MMQQSYQQQVAQSPQILPPRFPSNIHQPQPPSPHIYHHQYPPYSSIAPPMNIPSSSFAQPRIQHSTSIPQHPDPKKMKLEHYEEYETIGRGAFLDESEGNLATLRKQLDDFE